MSRDMTELEAARFVRAALRLIRDAVPAGTTARVFTASAVEALDLEIKAMEQDAPPWEPEPTPAAEYPWSQVVPGDSVRAPNGTWYPVDSVARLDVERMSVLLVGTGGAKIPSKPSAGDMVPVQRGPAGKAVDVFRAGGLELTALGVGR